MSVLREPCVSKEINVLAPRGRRLSEANFERDVRRSCYFILFYIFNTQISSSSGLR
jgi:hypothetical protein